MLEVNETQMSALQKELEVQLRQDFVDDCTQKIETVSGLFDQIAEGKTKNIRGDLLTSIGEIHSIKGMGTSFGFPAITVIAHRLEDFLSKQDSIDALGIKDSYVFLDKITELLGTQTQPGSEEISKIVRDLPTGQTVDIKVEQPKSIEVLSIMPKSVQQRLINEELAACGFRVSNLESSFEALNVALNARPDLIVVSAIVDMISGIELANMLRALNAMENTPIIVVTSFDERELPDEQLPKNAAIARKGPKFADDLSQCLIELHMMD